MNENFEANAQRTQAAYDDVALPGAYAWRYHRTVGDAARITTRLDPGLYICAGQGDLRTQSPQYGGYESKEQIMALICVGSEGAAFDTEIRPGAAYSFGLHVTNLDPALPLAQLDAIVAITSKRPMLLFEGSLAQRMAPLQAPIDPWFQGDARKMVITARALELVATVSQELAGPARSEVRAIDIKRAYAVRDTIEQDLSKTFRLADLSSLLGADASLLTRAFRAVFDESIAAHLTRRRMENAAAMLSDGASVKSAARSNGYTPNAFSSAFRRHYGYAPSALRR
ncbi:MAG: AraC family transcriptional regulator [Pseudomonadota bacterium]